MPFVATTPRFFVFNVLGGSEPNLKIQVARLQTENETNVDAVEAPKEVLIGINRCPVPSCPGKGENSVRTDRLDSRVGVCWVYVCGECPYVSVTYYVSVSVSDDCLTVRPSAQYELRLRREGGTERPWRGRAPFPRDS